jgi:hypothetical protein
MNSIFSFRSIDPYVSTCNSCSTLAAPAISPSSSLIFASLEVNRARSISTWICKIGGQQRFGKIVERRQEGRREPKHKKGCAAFCVRCCWPNTSQVQSRRHSTSRSNNNNDVTYLAGCDGAQSVNQLECRLHVRCLLEAHTCLLDHLGDRLQIAARTKAFVGR